MSNVETAFEYFLHHGFTAQQSAGIVGNLIQESGVNPESQQAGGPGRGIAQWSQGGRWNPALMSGNVQKDLNAQLNFVLQELQSNPGFGLAALKQATTPEQAASVFGLDYERYGVAGARVQDATQVYRDALSGHWPTNSSGSVNVPSGGNAGAPTPTSGITGYALTSSFGGSVISGVLGYIFGPAAGLSDVGKIAQGIGTFLGVGATDQPQAVKSNTFLSSIDELLNPSVSLFAPWKIFTMFIARGGVVVLGFMMIMGGLYVLVQGTNVGRELVGEPVKKAVGKAAGTAALAALA